MAVMQFQPLSPEQANPFLYGLRQMSDALNTEAQTRSQNISNQYLPQSLQAQILGLDLGNQKAQAQLPFAGPQAQADLNLSRAQTGLAGANANYLGQEAKYLGPTREAEIALQNAQTRMANQTANYYPYGLMGNLDPISKMRMGYMLANRLGGGLPNQQQAAPQGAPPQMGVQGNPSPFMQPNAMQGGGTSAPPMPQNAAQQSPDWNSLYGVQLRNTLSSMLRDPTTGSSRGGGGATYTDPFTGQKFTTDTMSNVTQDQKSIAALQRVNPLIQELTQTLPQFQTLSGKGKLEAQRLGNLFGANYQLPSQYARGQSNLKTAPEGLLKAYGLNVTDDSLKNMQEAIEPLRGESAQGYGQRIIKTLQDLDRNQGQSQNRLASGTPLQNTQPNVYRVATKSGAIKTFTDEDIMHTAKLHKMTPEQVKAQLGVQ